MRDLIEFLGLIFVVGIFFRWHSVWIIPSILLLYGLIRPEKLEKWSSWFYRLFCWLGSSFQCRYIAADIQSRLNGSIKQMNYELNEVAPYEIKIHWLKGKEIETDKDSFIEGNNVVVIMKQYLNQDRNLVLATVLYTSLGILPEAKNYIFPKMSSALDLAVIKKILALGGKYSALNYFVKNVLQPERDRDKETARYYEIMEMLDEFGILSRIFMAELLDLSMQLYPKRLGEPNILFETHNLLSFCERIAQRKYGEEINLDFNKQGMVRMSVIMVAKAERREKGIVAYMWRFKDCAKNGSKFVYFLGFHDININFTRNIMAEIIKQKLGNKISENIYSSYIAGKRIKTICMRMEVSNSLIREIAAST